MSSALPPRLHEDKYEEQHMWEEAPSTPSKSQFRARRPYVSPLRRRVLIGALGALVTIVCTSLLLRKSGETPSALTQQSTENKVDLTAQNSTQPKYSPWLLGAPTQSFRDNLRPEFQYITSWLSAGWNNDVITYINLIYLGMITERIPIIANFVPMHIGSDAEMIMFGDIFDVPRFIEEAAFPLLEWRQVKDSKSEVWDDLGCWDVWEASQLSATAPRHSILPDVLKLDLSYTKAPEWVKLIPGYEHDPGSSFWALARLAFPEDREESLKPAYPSILHNKVLEPDEQLMCYDYVYYVGAMKTWEFDFSYAPSWRFVGRYLHFTKSIEDLTRSYVNQLFGLSPNEKTPAYITIHVRHGDFKDWCWDAELPEDCFAPISVIARRVKEVQDELSTRRNIHVPTSRVIMTSDEHDEKWWEEVTAQGWVRMDHAKFHTEELYGKWYPVILDAAIQAAGVGIVGTDRSTFSILSRRRVLDWNEGVARMVKWGRKGADDH